jgi:hypothetical protein
MSELEIARQLILTGQFFSAAKAVENRRFLSVKSNE